MNDQLDLKAIGKRIRAQRENLNLTREELAEKLGLTSKFYGDLEYGTKGMSLTTLVNLSRELKLSTDYILRGYEYPLVEDEKLTEALYIRESIMAPLYGCSLPQLRRAEQIMRIFMSAVNEVETKDDK